MIKHLCCLFLNNVEHALYIFRAILKIRVKSHPFAREEETIKKMETKKNNGGDLTQLLGLFARSTNLTTAVDVRNNKASLSKSRAILKCVNLCLIILIIFVNLILSPCPLLPRARVKFTYKCEATRSGAPHQTLSRCRLVVQT